MAIKVLCKSIREVIASFELIIEISSGTEYIEAAKQYFKW